MSSAINSLISQPNTSSQYSQSSTSLPSWYTDYTQRILNDAAQFAAQPYQTYQGPRIAQQSGLTNQAYSQAQPLSQNATANTQAASNLVSAAGNNANNPLSAAQSYLSAGTNPAYNTVQNYMNPYNQNVTDAIAQAGARNFNNYIMPSLQSSIIGSGNITGSSTQGANLMQNAAQQEEQNVSNAQAGALQSGYQGSLAAAQNANANNLTAANTAGSLSQAGVNNLINAGSTLSNVGAQGTNTNLNAINAENALGQQGQGYNQSNLNLAYQDYLNQKNYPMTQASAMQSALSGIQVPTGTTNYNYGSGNSQTSPLSTLLGLFGNTGN